MGPADAKLVRNNNGISEPEFRLPPTMVYVEQHFGPSYEAGQWTSSREDN